MHAVRTHTEYRFDVDRDQFIALLDYETHLLHKTDEPDHTPLMTTLGNLGCDNIEYNAHFGAAIYFRLDAEKDNPFKHKAIAKCIRENLRIACGVMGRR